MGRQTVKVIRSKRYGRYVLRWRDRGRWREKLTEIEATKKNRKKAERLAAELEDELNVTSRGRMTWLEFQQVYKRDRLEGLSRSYLRTSLTVLDRFESIVRLPEYVDEIETRDLTEFAAGLRREGKSPATVTAYLKTIGAALSWAKENGLIRVLPTYRQKTARRKSGMRSRPITAEEFDRMIAVVEHVRPDDPSDWIHYLWGLWLSGLRLTESVDLSWDWRRPFSVDLQSRYPSFRILAEYDKGRTDRILPMAPEFAEFLRDTPESNRRGRVFRLDYQPDWVGSVIAEIGAVAGVIVNHKDKTATAHDLRRAFATRWAKRLAPAELQQLMRHASIETTMQFYVHLDADDLGSKLWQKGGQMGGQTHFLDATELPKNSRKSKA